MIIFVKMNIKSEILSIQNIYDIIGFMFVPIDLTISMSFYKKIKTFFVEGNLNALFASSLRG